MLDLKVFDRVDLEKIHSSSLKILEEIGINIPHRKILDIFKKNGAIVNYDDDNVKIPSRLSEDLIKNILKNQSNNQSIDNNLVEIKGWMGLSKTTEIIDYSDFNKRESTLRDILESITVGNSLENVQRISCLARPGKYDGQYYDILNHYLLYLFSKKRYFLGTIESVNSAKCIIEMAKIIAENKEELTNGRLAEGVIEPTANLSFPKRLLDIAYEFAQNKMKIFIGYWCWMGEHTPMNYVSAITLYNTNLLASMFIVMLLNPDYKYFDYIGDMFTANKNDESSPLFGSPNQFTFIMAVSQLAKYYGFKKCVVNTGVSDSIENNFQSGFEKGVTDMAAIMLGLDIMGYAGIVGSDRGLSLRNLVIDNEIFSYLNFMLNRKIKISDEDININGIENFAIGKSFYGSESNKRMVKDSYWDSDIFLAEKYEDWEKNKVNKYISNKINGILRENFPPRIVISDHKLKEIDKVLKAYIKDDVFLSSFKTELNEFIDI